jgi:ribose/xylose/arabinose/galactoside ABC-type transport system permease subunit
MPLWRRLLASDSVALLLAAVWVVVVWPFAPDLLSSHNVAILVTAALPLFVVAAGQTIVLISGGIDLSVTATIALASVAGAWVASADTGVLGGGMAASVAGVAAMLAAGAAVGGFNGLIIARTSCPPFIVTLTSLGFVSGLAIWLTSSRNIGGLPDAFTAAGRHLWLTVAIVLVVGGAAHLLLARTLAGRWWRAIGYNTRAARVSGVPVARLTLLAYVASGVCAAIASLLYTGRLETGSPVLGQRLLLDVMGAAVLGGTSLFGGRGQIAWTAGGVVLITLIDSSLNLLGLTYFAIMMVKGAVILAAAVFDALRQRWREIPATIAAETV